MAFNPKKFREDLKPEEQKVFDQLKRNIKEDWEALIGNVKVGCNKPGWSDDRAVMEVIRNGIRGKNARPPAPEEPPKDEKKNEGSSISPSKVSPVIANAGSAKLLTRALQRAQLGLRDGIGKREGSNLQSPLASAEKLY